jgi:hypothetical protein
MKFSCVVSGSKWRLRVYAWLRLMKAFEEQQGSLSQAAADQKAEHSHERMWMIRVHKWELHDLIAGFMK